MSRGQWRVLAGAVLVGSAVVTATTAQSPPSLRLHFVVIGEVPQNLFDHLVAHFQTKLGVTIAVLPPLSFDQLTFDPSRSQVVAEDLIRAVRFRYASLVRDPRVRVIGITPYDMYMEAMRDKWRFAFSLRGGNDQVAIVSYARMGPVNRGGPPNEDLLRSRLRKMIAKNVGVIYYGLPLSQNPKSAMYHSILGVDDLDRMSEDFNPN